MVKTIPWCLALAAMAGAAGFRAREPVPSDTVPALVDSVPPAPDTEAAVSGAAAAPARDTIPPRGAWLAPAPLSVLTTDQVRVAVEARDEAGGSGLARAVFYQVLPGSGLPPKKIGEAGSRPYEIRWDCTGLPDYHLRGLGLECWLYDRAGNVQKALQTAPGRQDTVWDLFVLHRDRRRSDSSLISSWRRDTLTIDGSLADWRAADSAAISINDNQLVLYSQWDTAGVYLGIKVLDRSVIGSGDAVVLFFNPRHASTEMMDSTMFQLIFSPAGKSCRLRRHLADPVRMEAGPAGKQYACRVLGTVDREDDMDSGYVMEIAIPWSLLDLPDHSGAVMGFDFQNLDVDFQKGQIFSAGWSETNMDNSLNPGRWGSLKIERKDLWFPLLCAGGVFIILAGLFSLGWRKRAAFGGMQSPPNAPAQPIIREQVQKAIEYIAAHFTEEDLGAETISQQIGLSSAYFGTLFKKETGQSFVEYINTIRLHKAEEMLKTTKMDVAQIAYAVGFGNLFTFNKIFRKIKGMAPTQYRKSEKN